MRFYLDHDVDAACRRILQQADHECWTAADAGNGADSDDDQAFYATSRGAVLVSHDQQFRSRRKKSTIGQHVFLGCAQPDGPELLAHWLPEVVAILGRKPDVVIELRPQSLHLYSNWK